MSDSKDTSFKAERQRSFREISATIPCRLRIAPREFFQSDGAIEGKGMFRNNQVGEKFEIGFSRSPSVFRERLDAEDRFRLPGAAELFTVLSCRR